MDWMKIISCAVDEIENHLCDNITAASLAEKYFISPFYFQKMFSVICNCTISEYIRNRRMTSAGYEIAGTKISVTEIAFKYGYESNESFTRAFTRFHGVSPSEARRKNASLTVFPRINPILNLTGGNAMDKLSERGYIVKEAGSVYYTEDMDRTLDWFKNVLGWYGQIENRDENNIGLYGCVSHMPMEIEMLHTVPFAGFHMFRGEPIQKMTGFMSVRGIDNLHAHVKKSGWDDISEIKDESWGAKSCIVKTIDGSILKFFEIY